MHAIIIVISTDPDMADWHLKELMNAMQRSGWRFVTELPGDGYRISATWEFERDTSEPNVLIDFDGLDDLKTLPLDESYGCSFRNLQVDELYFGRKGASGSSQREKWFSELSAFVASLEIQRAQAPNL